MSREAVPERYQDHPVVTAAEMAAVDRRAIEEYGIPALVLMENAGKAVAVETVRFIREELRRDPAQAMITVCCGRGNNGGDGLVAARHLKASGAQVVAYIAAPKRGGEYGVEVAENLRRAVAAGVSVQEVDEGAVGLDVRLRSSDVLIDALLGTGSAGKPAGVVKTMIQRMMQAHKPILAVDIPSGIQPDSGYHSGVFISAAETLTLGLPKKGLLAAHAAKNVGTLRVIDIGFPKDLVR